MDIELIYSISEIDREIQLKERQISDKTIPDKLSKIRNEYNGLKKEYDNISNQYQNAAKAIQDLTVKIEDLTSEVKETERKLYNSSNIKNIEVMQKSLEKINSEIKIYENEIYNLLEEQEKAKQNKNELRKKLVELRDLYNPIKDDYQNHINALKESILELNEKRISIISKLDTCIVKEYELIKKSKGYGTSMVKGEICTGCGMNVPYIIISRARGQNELQKCPNCGRFLYIKE